MTSVGCRLIPTTELEFLGIVIDSVRMELRMSDVRLNAVKAELNSWLERRAGTKREMLSLIGKLVFLCRVIKPGRIFMRRLITLATKAKKLHHRILLSKEARGDIVWWTRCADQWNGRSVFYEDRWSTSVDLELYSDASGLGIGAVFGRRWMSMPFTEPQKHYSIAWRELYAVLAACATWGRFLTGSRVLIFCDNSSVVSIVNTGASRCSHVMSLVRALFDVCVYHDFDVRLRHVPGVENVAADRLSRLDFIGFKSLFAGAYDCRPTECVLGQV